MIKALVALLASLTVAVVSASADPSALVTLAVAKRGLLSPQITAYGTVAADSAFQITIAMPREGRILAVAVRPGAAVNKGDPIVTIETSPAGASQYAQAASTLSFARTDLEHTRRLYSEQLATKSQLGTAEKAYSDARAAMLQQQKIGANHASDVLPAPAGGVVVSLGANPGEVVQPGTVIATIANRNHLSLDLGIEPADATYVRAGASVSMRSRQDDNLNFTSRIASIAAMVDSQTRLVNAVVQVPDAIAPRLLVGMTLIGRIDLAPHAGIVVPRPALLTDAEGTYVVAVKNGVAQRRGVSVALETDKWALVARGLSQGDRIAVDGTAGVTSGMHVRTR